MKRGLWSLTPLSTIFQLYRGGQFYCWRNMSTRRKPPTCSKSLTNFITMWYRVHLAWVGFGLTTLVVIDTYCIGSCNSSFHTITTTTAPPRLRLYKNVNRQAVNQVMVYRQAVNQVMVYCWVWYISLCQTVELKTFNYNIHAFHV